MPAWTMSSVTSIDESAARPMPAAERPERTPDNRDALRPWHFFVLVSLIAATVAVVMAREARPEHLILISFTIGAAGFAGAALYRALLPLVARAEPDSAPLSESARSVLEREKLLVLRSIKELEFDRAMGKISAGDFDEMAGRLRARAISLIRQLDATSGYGELIERELEARLTAAGRKRKPRTTPGPSAGIQPPAAALCVCGTENDKDAAFCKRCGARLAGEARV